MTGSNKLTKKDYLVTSLRAFFLQNGFNYSNYQGIGYANVIYPALKKHYGNDQKALCKALEDNCEFYNTNPHFLPFITSLHLVTFNFAPNETIRTSFSNAISIFSLLVFGIPARSNVSSSL